MVMARTIGGDYAPQSASRELHVLAVDDSHVDRKVIERLLKISSCRGTPTFRSSLEKKSILQQLFIMLSYIIWVHGCMCASIENFLESLQFFFWLVDGTDWMGLFAVTAVESAGRALQYLGLDGDKSAVGFDVRTLCSQNWNFFDNLHVRTSL